MNDGVEYFDDNTIEYEWTIYLAVKIDSPKKV